MSLSLGARTGRLAIAMLTGTSMVGLGFLTSPAQAAECSGTPSTYEMDPDHHSYTATDPAGEVIIGTPGDDIIKGGPGSDIICGQGGDDIIEGGGGAIDQLFGGTGDDHLDTQSVVGKLGCCLGYAYGERGDDVLVGGDGADTLSGGVGRDNLTGRGGPDKLWGGQGSDRVFGGPGDDDVNGGNSQDAKAAIQHQFTTSGDGADQLYGGSDTDAIYGDGGNDTIDALDAGADTVGGGPGSSDRCFVDNDAVTPDCEKLS